jgi:DivIVA domain-containing protein
MTPDQIADQPPLAAAYQQLVDASPENGGFDIQQGLEDVRRRAKLADVREQDLRAHAPRTLTAADVQNKQFSTTRLRPGYDEQEVDAFLDEVATELTRLTLENAQFRARLAEELSSARTSMPSTPAAPLTDGGTPPTEDHAAGEDINTVARVLVLARQVADQAIADGRREADEMLSRARLQADDIQMAAHRQAEQVTGDARARAESLERDAQQRHRQAMGSLVKSREELERRIDDLRTFEYAYRDRLKAYLESQLRDLEASTADSGVFPAVAAAGSSLTNPPAEHYVDVGPEPAPQESESQPIRQG